MKLARSLLLIAAVGGEILITTGAGGGTATEGNPLVEGKYKLTARVETSADNPEEHPQLFLTLQNQSPAVIYLVETVPFRDFNLDIKDDSGQRVPPKSSRPESLVINEGKQSLVPVDPGQQASYVIDLDSLYSLASGKYTLRVERSVFLSDKQTTVKIESVAVKFALK